MHRFGVVLSAVLFGITALAFPALGQVRLEYRFGDEGQGGATGPSASERSIREGWGALWGQGGDGGTASGQIGSVLPPAEYSRRQLQIEAARATAIRQQIREVQNAPPPVQPQEHLRRYVQERELQGLEKYRQTRDPDDLYVPWRSQDPNIKTQLGEVYYILRTAQPENQQQAELALLGLEGVRLADESAAGGDTEDAAFYFSVARATADILVGVDPVTGTLRSVYEAVTGINFVTNEALSPCERGIAVFGVITLGYGQKFGKGVAAAQKLITRSRLGNAAWEASLAYAKHFGEGFRKFAAVGASAEDALTRYASVLREAADGPRLRMEVLAEGTDDLGDAALRRYPDLYKADNGYVHNMPPKSRTVRMSRAETDAVGGAWVGPQYTELRDGDRIVSYTSKDGRYVYRRPELKGSGKVQANLEIHVTDRSKPLSNFHIEITDP